MQTFAGAKAAIQEAREFHRLVWNTRANREATYFGGLYPHLEASFVEVCRLYTKDAKQYGQIPVSDDTLPVSAETADALRSLSSNIGIARENFDARYAAHAVGA